MHKFVYHNGRVLPLSEVRLSPGQAGLLNGWGVFSTLRIYRGRPFEFDHHFDRLARDAERIALSLPYQRRQVHDAVLALIAANHLQDGCMRIYFVNNQAAIWSSGEQFPQTDWIMYSVDLPMRVGAVKLALQANGRYAAHPLAGTKVTSWLQNVWAVDKAHHRGFEDAILLNEFGNVTECTAANLYIVKNGEVITPPLSSGCLAGVSRLLLEELGPRAGVPIVERDFTAAELYAADEVFISSTTRQVQAVEQIEDTKYVQAPGPLTNKLAKLFDDYVKQSVVAEAAMR
jgi:branched-chain amino acid aminotransferase